MVLIMDWMRGRGPFPDERREEGGRGGGERAP